MPLMALWANGKWKGEPCPVHLKEGGEPCTKTFSALRVHTETLQQEAEQLSRIGYIEEKVNWLEWASPSFVIPKKDKTGSSINAFQELNMKIVKIIMCPLPKVQDALLKPEGFQHAISLNLNRGCYQIWLDKESSNCVHQCSWGQVGDVCPSDGLM
jgi:hypothetical protein